MVKAKKILVLCTTDSMIWNFLIPHIYALQNHDFHVECACSKTGVYFNELEKQYKFIMHEIHFERSPYSLSNLKAYKELCVLVRDEQIDTIFCHEPVGGAMGRLVGRKFGCKVIYIAHGFHFYKGAPIVNKIIYYNVEKVLSYFTDVLVTINQEDYCASKKFHAKSTKLINGIGIDTNKFKRMESNWLREQFHLKEDDFVALSVGELIPRKNHMIIIKAMKRMNNPQLHYFIAGEGELKHQIEHFVNEYGLTNNVHLLGFRRNINEICNSCDLFVMPSVQEGLSVALMEAMGCGKAVLASKIRGNVDLIVHDKGGKLVPTFDVNQYAEQLDFFFSNKSLLKQYGDYNYYRVKNFDLKTVESQILSFFV